MVDNATSAILLEYLAKAEAWFGERDKRWRIGAAVHRSEGNPHTYLWPGSSPPSVDIWLSQSAENNDAQTRFQLAHEVAHLLSPTERTTMLEEGIAEVLRARICHEEGTPYFTTDKDYLRARALVETLLSVDQDAVKKLRAIPREISKISSLDIQRSFPEIPPDIADELAVGHSDWKAAHL